MQASDIAVERANSKDDLQDIFDSDFRGLIVSMIHKFEEIKKDSSPRDNIYVFIDEAHRSVAADLGTYLMARLPNATIIGFTGTPVGSSQGRLGLVPDLRHTGRGRLPRQVLDHRVDRGRDDAADPLHAGAVDHDACPTEQLDEQFFALAESEDVTDVDELNRVLDRAVGLRAFLSADDRVEQGGRVRRRTTSRRTSARWATRRSWSPSTARPAPSTRWRSTSTCRPSGRRSSTAERRTTSSTGRWSPSCRSQRDPRGGGPQVSSRSRTEEPKILIVTDKLLTGYDAPVLYAMYLDKPMRDHVLLQAIARVNRPYVDSGERQQARRPGRRLRRRAARTEEGAALRLWRRQGGARGSRHP